MERDCYVLCPELIRECLYCQTKYDMSIPRPDTTAEWTKSNWRSLPANQQPVWPDAGVCEDTLKKLSNLPALVFAGETRTLTKEMADVQEGKAFVLQAGDCSEDFSRCNGPRIHDIPTISCTQNFDALGDDFDSISSNLGAYRSAKIPSQRRLAVYATLTDFANELQSLAQCDERLCISKIEAGLMSGLGLSYYYYPYLPVGGLRQRQDRIRERRLSSPRESGLYLLIGSASYAPIRKSCEWFIQNAREHSLPPNVRVVVLGAGTEKLLPEGKSVRGIEVKGWTEQEELDDLLVKAQAVLVPQQFGFGAPTRLPELSCAGIPVIGCYHPTYAIDPPPGFHATEATWDAWYKRMEELRRETVDVTVEQYDAWESAQPKPLQLVVRNLLS